MSFLLNDSRLIALSGAALAFVLRLLLDSFYLDWEWRVSYLIFIVVIVVYLGIYSQRKQSNEYFTFVMDFKGGLTTGLLYALLLGIFTFSFYAFIHADFLQTIVDTRAEEILEQASQNGWSEKKTKQLLDNFEQFAGLIYRPLNWSVLTVLAASIMSVIYASIFALIARNYPQLFGATQNNKD
ncbi:MAG TPA: hypothetical protein DDX92_05760 [Flavobacteriales bacterium]|jgi:hypothetical protein|nr:hypothetical protein [Flavobacteriales bacterium]